MSDPAGELRFSPRTPAHRYSRWRWLAAAAVFALHVALLSALLLDRIHVESRPGVVTEITFIPREAPAPEHVDAALVIAATPTARRQTPAKISNPALQADVVPAQAQAPRPLRLGLSDDPWQQPRAVLDHNPLADRPPPALPGRADAIVDGVALQPVITPEMRVKAIAAFVFGAQDVDPCPGARQRIANPDPRRSRHEIEADLRTIERHCRR